MRLVTEVTERCKVAERGEAYRRQARTGKSHRVGRQSAEDGGMYCVRGGAPIRPALHPHKVAESTEKADNRTGPKRRR